MDLTTAARALVAALDDLDGALSEALAADEAPREALVALLAILDRSGSHDLGAKQRLSDLIRRLGSTIGGGLQFRQQVVVEGVGVLQQTKSGRSYGWTDGRLIAHRIAVMAAEERTTDDLDPETGEVMTPPLAVVAGRIAEALIECGGLDTRSAGWRTEPLRARGIDPSEYREVTNPGSTGVKWLD